MPNRICHKHIRGCLKNQYKWKMNPILVFYRNPYFNEFFNTFSIPGSLKRNASNPSTLLLILNSFHYTIKSYVAIYVTDVPCLWSVKKYCLLLLDVICKHVQFHKYCPYHHIITGIWQQSHLEHSFMFYIKIWLQWPQPTAC